MEERAKIEKRKKEKEVVKEQHGTPSSKISTKPDSAFKESEENEEQAAANQGLGQIAENTEQTDGNNSGNIATVDPNTDILTIDI